MKHAQKKRLLDYLKSHDGLLMTDCFSELGFPQPARRVNDLRKDGWDIKTDIVRVGSARVARYSLPEQGELF